MYLNAVLNEFDLICLGQKIGKFDSVDVIICFCFWGFYFYFWFFVVDIGCIHASKEINAVINLS